MTQSDSYGGGKTSLVVDALSISFFCDGYLLGGCLFTRLAWMRHLILCLTVLQRREVTFKQMSASFHFTLVVSVSTFGSPTSFIHARLPSVNVSPSEDEEVREFRKRRDIHLFTYFERCAAACSFCPHFVCFFFHAKGNLYFYNKLCLFLTVINALISTNAGAFTFP